MTQAGITVPPGFVILADAFDSFLHQAEIHTEIDAILHKVDHKAMHTVEQASEEIKAIIRISLAANITRVWINTARIKWIKKIRTLKIGNNNNS